MRSFLQYTLSYFLLLISKAYCDEYTHEEKKLLEKFRPLVKDTITEDYQNADSFLVTWLRAKNSDLKAAEEMFRASQKWRKANKIDTILNETLLEFNAPPYTINGYDYDGNPILIFTPTHIDLRRLIIQGQREQVVRLWWQMLERMGSKRRETEKRLGKDIVQSVSIVDLNGWNRRQHFCLACASVYAEWFTTLEKYWPARVKHFVIINVPRVALPFIELIRPLTSPMTQKVFKAFPPDKKVWSVYLSKIAAPDQLPYRFGGTQKD